MNTRRPNQRRGFTIVEAIVSMVIIGTLGSMVSSLIFRAATTYTNSAMFAQVHSELSMGLDRIDRTMREIPLKSGYGSVAPNITSVTSTSISFGASGSIALSGTQLMLTPITGGTAGVLLNDVSSFSVQAYDQSNGALATTLSGTACDAIRRLGVTITMTRNGTSATLRNKVFIRSTMSGVVAP